jgi:tetratricopeptide (TPR) repeat protein
MATTPNKTDKDTARRLTTPAANSSDTVTDPIAGLYARWILPYSWRIAVIILVALACIALAKALGSRRVERDGEGFAALSKAESVSKDESTSKDDSTAALLAVARDYDGTPVAARAQLEAARNLYDEGKYDQAITKYSLARKGAGDAAISVAAALGEAYALEASGKPETAEKGFADTAGTVGSDALALDAWLGAGRCAKAQGKLAEAERYYDKAKQAAKDSPIARRRVEDAMAALAATRYATRPTEPAKAAAAPAAAPAPASTP